MKHYVGTVALCALFALLAGSFFAFAVVAILDGSATLALANFVAWGVSILAAVRVIVTRLAP